MSCPRTCCLRSSNQSPTTNSAAFEDYQNSLLAPVGGSCNDSDDCRDNRDCVDAVCCDRSCDLHCESCASSGICSSSACTSMPLSTAAVTTSSSATTTLAATTITSLTITGVSTDSETLTAMVQASDVPIGVAISIGAGVVFLAALGTVTWCCQLSNHNSNYLSNQSLLLVGECFQQF